MEDGVVSIEVINADTTHGQKNLRKLANVTRYEAKPISRESKKAISLQIDWKIMTLGTVGVVGGAAVAISFLAIVVPSLLIAFIVFLMSQNAEKERKYKKEMKEMDLD